MWHQKTRCLMKSPVLFFSPPGEKKMLLVFGKNVQLLQKGAFGGLDHRERREAWSSSVFFLVQAWLKLGFCSPGSPVFRSSVSRALRCTAVYISPRARVARLLGIFLNHNEFEAGCQCFRSVIFQQMLLISLDWILLFRFHFFSVYDLLKLLSWSGLPGWITPTDPSQ